ncbi:MAG: ABC transporter permease [Aeromicrobium sp.]|uniref:ABC transporter permease n=1 Tax=Aeromicrobium sp. TaxID=1871063 RepID=UPI0039E2DB9E
MFLTHLKRELGGRRKQTAIIAIGMAVAIALVIVVNAFAAGVRDAQDEVLESVYGVGTDITVTQAPEAGSGGPGGGQFDFDEDAGESTDDGTRQLSQQRLSAARGSATFAATSLATVADLDGVAGAVATLTLESTSFSGEIPDAAASSESGSSENGPPSGGGGSSGGGGPSSFSIDRFTVTGVDATTDALGPLTTMEITDGEGLSSAGASDAVAVLDSVYASEVGLAVGDTLSVAGTDLSIIGIATSTSGEGVATESNVYIPLTLAQSLSGLTDQVSTIYVQATSADAVSTVAADIEAALPDQSVETQEDLASSVTGSLSSAADLASSLGKWLSVAVLAAAFGLAILFTVSGVNRRTRELGTLKAIGWSRRRVVAQVAGESLVQSLIGGLIGAVVGLLAIIGLNLAKITLTAAQQAAGGPDGAGGGPGGGGPGGGGSAQDAATSAVDLILRAPISPQIIAIALGVAIVGGLLAGAVGGWRAARLSPAVALRSLA